MNRAKITSYLWDILLAIILGLVLSTPFLIEIGKSIWIMIAHSH